MAYRVRFDAEGGAREKTRVEQSNGGFGVRTEGMYTHSFRSLSAGGRGRWKCGFLRFERNTEGCNEILNIWKGEGTGKRVKNESRRVKDLTAHRQNNPCLMPDSRRSLRKRMHAW